MRYTVDKIKEKEKKRERKRSRINSKEALMLKIHKSVRDPLVLCRTHHVPLHIPWTDLRVR